ncbi:hypothetical protein Taro_018917 [Colocasia esculenta]|uniref:Uncharacterized protein n=1 Tax=Colocasia esculenta TaxID=4460 RepID=A0A843UXM8_COLES|nr:hypothetical protein [Colocasia esculenta]
MNRRGLAHADSARSGRTRSAGRLGARTSGSRLPRPGDIAPAEARCDRDGGEARTIGGDIAPVAVSRGGKRSGLHGRTPGGASPRDNAQPTRVGHDQRSALSWGFPFVCFLLWFLGGAGDEFGGDGPRVGRPLRLCVPRRRRRLFWQRRGLPWSGTRKTGSLAGLHAPGRGAPGDLGRQRECAWAMGPFVPNAHMSVRVRWDLPPLNKAVGRSGRSQGF